MPQYLQTERKYIMPRRNSIRTVVALLGLIGGMGLSHSVRAYDLGTDGDIKCAGDCNSELGSCCHVKYSNHSDCISCCSNTFGGTFPGGCYNPTSQADCMRICN